MTRPFARTAAATALVAAVALAGCSSDDDNASNGDTPAGDGIPVTAKDISFDKDAYEAVAGEVAFDLTNDGVLEHNLMIDGVDDFRIEVASNGDTASGSTTLDAGEYVIYCDVVGHREAGMEATLTVS